MTWTRAFAGVAAAVSVMGIVPLAGDRLEARGGGQAQVRQAQGGVQAQGRDRRLVGTWTLVSAEELVDGAPAVRVAGARGLLVFDGAGWVFEAVTRDARSRVAAAQSPLTEAQQTFAAYTGFWGSYTTDIAAARLSVRAEGALSPSVMGRDVPRAYGFEGDRLTLTSRPGEPHQPRITKWTWERVPPVEHLSSGYRKAVGFWQHVVEKRVNLTQRTEVATVRAPSVVVYTPSGYVGVYFPPQNRKPFAAEMPTDAEAREALRGYVGYFGALGVYPGMVFHHILASSGALSGQTLKRYFDVAPSGNEVNLRFPEGRSAQGDSTVTLVTLKRLSDAAAMLGE